MFKPILTIVLCCAGLPLQAQELDYAAANRAMTEEVAIPAVNALSQAAEETASSLSAFCGGDVNADPHRAFLFHLQAWQRVRPLAMGPLLTGNGPARFQYWPDKHGTGGKQLRRALQNKDPKLLNPNSLAEQSVALRDLEVLERLLFGKKPLSPNHFNCDFALAIAALQAGLANKLAADWRNYAQMIASADQGNSEFYDAADVTQTYLGAMQATLEVIHQTKLDRPLGENRKKARPKRAENWRSDQTLANIHANLSTIRSLFTIPAGPQDMMIATGSEALANGMAGSLSQAMETIENFNSHFTGLIVDDTGREKLNELRKQLVIMNNLLRSSVAASLDLSLGFNASDGD